MRDPEEVEVTQFGNTFRQFLYTDSDMDRSRQFTNLPVVGTPQALDALIEKVRKEFDPDAPPPYDGGHNGHR